MSSNAISSDRISSVVGYEIKKGDFRTTTPNLPQRILVLGEGNFANQGTMPTTTKQYTTAIKAAKDFGFGSPIHQILSILIPKSGSRIGGIPIFVLAQAQASGATNKQISILPSGLATKNGTHTLRIAGRESVQGKSYDININIGDTGADVTSKIYDAVNGIIDSPVTCAIDDYEALLTTKWKGLTANDLQVAINDNDIDLGIDYTITDVQAGSGTPSIADALETLGNEWTTIIVNGYGLVSSAMSSLEFTNGTPDPDSASGRYIGRLMKPYIAISGSVSEDPSSITDAREDQVTIAVAPAPLYEGFAFEAAANMTVLFANVSQNEPHLDVQDKYYPDLPAPEIIGLMSNYDDRDRIVKLGCSTVDLVAGKYQVKDFVTTYHPEGEEPPQFRYPRNLMIDFNVKYGVYISNMANVVGKALANNDDIVSVDNVVKPKDIIQLRRSYAIDLAKRALIADANFMKESIEVSISATNPDRIDETFRYKRTGIGRIVSTTGEAGFNFGTL